MERLHITDFSRYINKHQRLCEAIVIPISDEEKVIFFVGKMYARGEFKEKEMTDYEMSTNKDYDTALKLFSNFFAQRRA